MTPKLLAITNIPTGKADIEATKVVHHKALSSIQFRGLLRQVYITEKTTLGLTADIRCSMQKVVPSGSLGKNSKAILENLAGQQLSKKITYRNGILAVALYNPRPIICINCHNL